MAALTFASKKSFHASSTGKIEDGFREGIFTDKRSRMYARLFYDSINQDAVREKLANSNDRQDAVRVARFLAHEYQSIRGCAADALWYANYQRKDVSLSFPYLVRVLAKEMHEEGAGARAMEKRDRGTIADIVGNIANAELAAPLLPELVKALWDPDKEVVAAIKKALEVIGKANQSIAAINAIVAARMGQECPYRHLPDLAAKERGSGYENRQARKASVEFIRDFLGGKDMSAATEGNSEVFISISEAFATVLENIRKVELIGWPDV